MDQILKQIAFNLSSIHDFSPAFVAANQDFALAVIKEYQAAQQSQQATTVVEPEATQVKEPDSKNSDGIGVALGDQQSVPFAREKRYMVLKLKRMKPRDADFIRYQFGPALVDAVAVEADWPEFEKVWDMLEARMAAQ